MAKVHAIFYIVVLLFQMIVNLHRFPEILSYLAGIGIHDFINTFQNPIGIFLIDGYENESLMSQW